MTNKHWSRLFFKQPIIAVSSLKGGRQHQTDLIVLADGSQWVCKRLTPNTWLGTISSSQFALTEFVASQVAHELGYTFAPQVLHTVHNRNEEFNPLQLLIVPYCEGEVITAVTKVQAFLLGKLLAQLHQLKLPKINAKGFPQINLPKKQSHHAWIAPVVECCNAALEYEAENRVVSHRDLHLHNIIWQNTTKPHLIDWESSGLIHPFIELVGLSMNCSGLAAQQFEEELFRATLSGYTSDNAKLPQANDVLWDMSLHSWLLWYAYSLNQGWQDDARQTLEAMELIRIKMDELKQIYAGFYS